MLPYLVISAKQRGAADQALKSVIESIPKSPMPSDCWSEKSHLQGMENIIANLSRFKEAKKVYFIFDQRGTYCESAHQLAPRILEQTSVIFAKAPHNQNGDILNHLLQHLRVRSLFVMPSRRSEGISSSQSKVNCGILSVCVA